MWEENTNEERLLGVSLTGIMDNPLTTTANPDLQGLLERLRAVSVEVNAQWAAKLGVAVSTAITAVKPSGTVSQLVNSAVRNPCDVTANTTFVQYVVHTTTR